MLRELRSLKLKLGIVILAAILVTRDRALDRRPARRRDRAERRDPQGTRFVVTLPQAR